jgi:hypothetical protein
MQLTWLFWCLTRELSAPLDDGIRGHMEEVFGNGDIVVTLVCCMQFVMEKTNESGFINEWSKDRPQGGAASMQWTLLDVLEGGWGD